MNNDIVYDQQTNMRVRREVTLPLILLLEVEVLEAEVDLYDAGGLDPGPEDVLLGGLVVLGTQPIKVVQETKLSVKNLKV